MDANAHMASDTNPTDISANANAALAKENVYRVSEIEIPELADNGNVGVESMAHYDGTIYAAMKISDWENGNTYFALSMDERGNSINTVFLELPWAVLSFRQVQTAT